jgi:hypothetical protein
MRIDRDGRAHYYEIATPFTIEVLVGRKPANVWIGRSQALQALYETVTLRTGDELHCLPGGDFLIRAGEVFDFATRRHDASEILLHPAPWDPPLPLDKLREIPEALAHKPASYRTEITIAVRRTVPA